VVPGRLWFGGTHRWHRRHRRAEQRGRLDAGRRRRLLVERIAQRELNLALGAGERQSFGFERIHQQGDHGHRARLAAIGTLFDLGSCGQDLHVAQHDLRHHLRAPFSRVEGREHVHARAGQHVAGDADDLVDADRQRTQAGGDDGRESRTGLPRSQLHGQHGLVFDQRQHQAAADHLVEGGEDPLRRGAGRPVDDLQIIPPQFGANLQVGRRDDDRLGRDGVARRGRHLLHVVVSAECQCAACRDGEHEHHENSSSSH
jgi:hypothetical protein